MTPTLMIRHLHMSVQIRRDVIRVMVVFVLCVDVLLCVACDLDKR